VAIHGHGGHWKTSWTDRDSGTFWLQHILPKFMPEARVITFGYDASDALAISVEDIGMNLMSGLGQLRRTEVSSRPISADASL
jgi:hypothetical protein